MQELKNEPNGRKEKPKSIYNLLSNSLKPENAQEEVDDEESQSDDEETAKIVARKISMNRVNVVGLNFEKYND